MMRSLAFALLLAAASCSGGGSDETATGAGETAEPAPVIAADMAMPVDEPFCAFSAEGSTPDGNYVFVTSLGDSVYHGYAKLDGDVTKLTEVEAGFGAGIETRRYVNDDESVELEVILLEAGETDAGVSYTGSVRPIFPAEGDAVKFEGACAYDGAADE
ncbi:hypothetical protein WNY37_07770 [Henriciella sp. AS95]|uniref:hypothetical protein n=1 Tax=Henriciella sp. AS95 TaxID=3135782 RepID=UPI0031806000